MGEENPSPPPQAAHNRTLNLSGVMDQIHADQQNIGEFEFNGAVEAANRVVMGEANEVNKVMDRATAAELREEAEKQRTTEAEYRATHDGLTGLLNKEGLEERLGARVAANRPFGVLGIDLDGFKKLNDEHGHPVGDEALALFGDFLNFLKETFAREDDDIARQGGDEFMILFDLNPGNSRRDAADPEAYLNAVIKHAYDKYEEFKVAHPRMEQMKLGMSVGGAMWFPGSEVKETLREADEAMYKNKNQRKSIEQHIQSVTSFS